MPIQTNTEIELKLRLADPDDWAAILALPAISRLNADQPVITKMMAHYFDTAELTLHKAGIAFRIRWEDSGWIATVKTEGTSSGGLHFRREWNVPVPDPEPKITCFQGTEAWLLLGPLVKSKALIPLFTTVFDRHKLNLTTSDDSKIELGVDLGLVRVGDVEETIGEVELELKDGNPVAVLRLGAQLAEGVSLFPETRSKYIRGLCLAGFTKPSAKELSVRHIDVSTDAITGMKQFLIVQINQVFNAGEGLLANPTDPESLHQLRVQLRRLRSLFSFAKPLMKQEDYPFWQEQLSLWSHSMNSLRETDILSELWHTMAKAQRLSLSPTPGLGALVQSERTKLLDKLLATNTEKQFIPLLLNFWAWLSAEAWSSPVESQPFADFATSQLRDWVGGLRKSAKVLPFDNILELHHIRIQGKKLRYLLEILPHKDRKSKLLLARLKSLQDFAGEIHDTHATAALLALWLKQHTSRTIHRDAGLVLGWMAFANSDTESNAENAWQRFRRAARRWLQE